MGKHPNLVAYYPFEGTQTNLGIDMSGNGDAISSFE